MSVPEYHKQPVTLDPLQDPPEDESPRGMAHGEELAAEVKDSIEEHKDAVEGERENEVVGARDPGDHASEDVEGLPGEGDTTTSSSGTSDQSASDQPTGPSDEQDSEQVPTGTVDEVKSWVGDDPDRAQRALEAERAGANRSSLISHLETVSAC